MVELKVMTQTNHKPRLAEVACRQAPIGLATLDSKLRFLYVNEQFAALLGRKVEDHLGRTLRQLLPELADAHESGLEQLFENGPPRIDQPFPVSGHNDRENSDRENSDHENSDLKNRTWLATFSPIHSPDGDVQGINILVRDASAEHRAHSLLENRLTQESLKTREAQIQHSQKLESLGVLAGGIAHDFNNILTGILGNAGLAQSRLPEGSSARRPLVEIEKAAQHAAELADQMLAYSGKGRFAIEPLDLDHLVGEIVHLLRLSITKKAQLEFHLARNLPQVNGDISQIRQVVMNLITNASDALGDQAGQITVSTELVNADHAFLNEMYLKENLSPGSYVCLKVSDTGCGMDRETQDRLFDPFFTTKTTGRGLGMAAVLGILRGHKGSVQVTSNPHQGTTFTVLLPASTESKLEEDLPQTTQSATSKKGIVLVVDDEEMVRTVARNILEDFGHEVLEASDGQEAVDLFSDSPSAIDAVLLDMTMPNIDGPETLRMLRHVKPQVRVLLSSGYSEQEALLLMADYDGVGFLKKPYLPGELIGKLQEFLDG